MIKIDIKREQSPFEELSLLEKIKLELKQKEGYQETAEDQLYGTEEIDDNTLS